MVYARYGAHFQTMDSAVLGLASSGRGCCKVRVFDRKLHSRSAIEFPAFAPLEVSMRVTNVIPLGCPLSYRFTL
jgi:hypothetical protein